MADELKPCPFCGGQPIMRREEPMLPNGQRDSLYYVECEARECQVRTLSWYPERAAIQSWNRRASSKPVRQPCRCMSESDRIARIEAFLDCRFAGAMSMWPYHRIDCACESDPLGRCVVHEKCQFTREQQIEAAARELLTEHDKWPGGLPYRFDPLTAALINALALPKEPFEPTPEPTEAEMRRAVMEVGWTYSLGHGWNLRNYSLAEAYRRVMGLQNT